MLLHFQMFDTSFSQLFCWSCSCVSWNYQHRNRSNYLSMFFQHLPGHIWLTTQLLCSLPHQLQKQDAQRAMEIPSDFLFWRKVQRCESVHTTCSLWCKKKKKKEHAVSEAEKKQGCGTHFPKRQPSGTFSLLQTDFWVCTKLRINLSTSVFVNCISSSGTVCYGKTLHLEESVHLRSSSKVSAAFIGLAYSWSFHSWTLNICL